MACNVLDIPASVQQDQLDIPFWAGFNSLLAEKKASKIYLGNVKCPTYRYVNSVHYNDPKSEPGMASSSDVFSPNI